MSDDARLDGHTFLTETRGGEKRMLANRLALALSGDSIEIAIRGIAGDDLPPDVIASASREVRSVFARMFDALSRRAYAGRPIVGDPKRRQPSPLERMAETTPDHPVTCPVCGPDPQPRCTLCHGDGEVTAADALDWERQRKR